MSLDGREENWLNSSSGFRTRKIEAAAAIHSIPSGRWEWTSGAAVSSRQFSNAFSDGIELKYSGSVTRTVLRDPARRLTVDSSAAIEAGKLFTVDRPRFAKIVSASSLRWGSFVSELQAGRGEFRRGGLRLVPQRPGPGRPHRGGPVEDAPPASGGHHRRRQVRLRQRDAVVDPVARDPASGPPPLRRVGATGRSLSRATWPPTG